MKSTASLVPAIRDGSTFSLMILSVISPSFVGLALLSAKNTARRTIEKRTGPIYAHTWLIDAVLGGVKAVWNGSRS